MSNKPKPTALKILQGNPGKRKLNPAEPKPCTKMPSRPQHLKGPALHEWNRITKYLEPLNMVTPVDRAALAAYCVAYGRWVEAERKIEEHGMLIKSSKGMPMQSPYVGMANRAMELMHKFLIEFGMTPSSRSQLHVPEQPKEDEFAKFENQIRGANAG